MATKAEELKRLQEEIAAHPENADEVIHVVQSERIRKERAAKVRPGGKPPQTRFTIDCDTHDAWWALWKEYDRVLETVGNKTIAISIVIWWLKLLTPERLAKKMAAGHDQ